MTAVLFPSIPFILSATRADMCFILSSPSEEEGKKATQADTSGFEGFFVYFQSILLAMVWRWGHCSSLSDVSTLLNTLIKSMGFTLSLYSEIAATGTCC